MTHWNHPGSTSTLHALAAARARAAGAAVRTSGVDGLRLRLYAAETAHSSVDKAALTLGLGLDAIRRIPADDAYRVRPDALAAAVSAPTSTSLAASPPTSTPTPISNASHPCR